MAVFEAEEAIRFYLRNAMRAGLSAKERESLRELFGGKCAYCGSELGTKWHADHVSAVMRKSEWQRDENGRVRVRNGRPIVKLKGYWQPENDHSGNLFPACVPCNIDKAACDLETWRRSLQDKINIALRSSNALRHAKRFGMVEVNEKPVVFWFEKYGLGSSAERKKVEP